MVASIRSSKKGVRFSSTQLNSTFFQTQVKYVTCEQKQNKHTYIFYPKTQISEEQTKFSNEEHGFEISKYAYTIILLAIIKGFDQINAVTIENIIIFITHTIPSITEPTHLQLICYRLSTALFEQTGVH